MSGGYLEDYYEYVFEDYFNTIKEDSPVFARMVYDLGDVLHKYDFWKAGDVSEKEFLNAWDEFCKKWDVKEPKDLDKRVFDYW
ncbi:MAG: hypothetical protein WCR24_06775 [Candidatus Methanomethylophilaceae archaeon]